MYLHQVCIYNIYFSLIQKGYIKLIKGDSKDI